MSQDYNLHETGNHSVQECGIVFAQCVYLFCILILCGLSSLHTLKVVWVAKQMPRAYESAPCQSTGWVDTWQCAQE